jgi:alpha-beta hydrolase superfamily lysophospholipase
MPRRNIRPLLEGGDRRTIGRSDQVAALVFEDPGLFPGLIAELWSEDPLVRMRAADAAEKVTRKKHELLQPYKKELLGLMTEARQQELRWHLAVMVPRLLLSARERRVAASFLDSYLKDRSSIVKTFALQGLADLALKDPGIRPAVLETLHEAARNGTPAMKARSRKLLARLERQV